MSRYGKVSGVGRWGVLIGMLLGSWGLSACGEGTRDPAGALEPAFQKPRRDGAFVRATDVYGRLLVRPGEESAESAHRPWSAWWYPAKETFLFEGSEGALSPLEKYDEYVRRTRGSESEAARFERERLYDPNASAWEGLCNAWAEAAVMELEPAREATLEGIRFGIGDLKALLVKTYESVNGLRQYGQRFNGDRAGVYDDIFPEQFHRVLQAELFEKGHPIIMDRDPGVAVWNTPIWMAQTRIERDPASATLLHVTTWVTWAAPRRERGEHSDVGTLSLSREYTYDLYGFERPDGAFEISHGEWTGISLDDHPDFLTVLPLGAPEQLEESRRTRASRNAGIAAEVVDEILSRTRGRLELVALLLGR
ncbi:MAG: hypothetical protein NDJ89_01055 [Oligoflexia bacterium]|nr:hypothetical protein [Oligoflexia bacterium]